MKTVYVVTVGEYSDYHIEAIFSTKEKAEEYKVQADKTSNGRSIEEWELDRPIPVIHTEVYMDKDGNVQDTELDFGNDVKSGFRLFYHSYHSGILLYWVVATEDRERAVKVVNEKRTQIIANDLWGKDKEVGELFGAEGQID